MAIVGASFSKQSSTTAVSAAFRKFQIAYLMVYFLMMAGDWLQGPYVYALYDAYGFSKADIAVLFVAGFGSSMVFGTFVGSLADMLGRKRLCLTYVLVYILSCMTKHVNRYDVLMCGRLLGGVATSLLFSVFEAWMVCEHNARQFTESELSQTFSMSSFGNSLVAIVAGVVAQAAADTVPLSPVSSINSSMSIMYGGYCAPFDLAIFVLAIGGALIALFWRENYGAFSHSDDTPAKQSLRYCIAKTLDIRGLQNACQLVLKDRVIATCGMIQSLFEGSMYIFVFMWTPALTPANEGKPPYGKMFATFMVCCMCGSTAFSWLKRYFSEETILKGAFLVSGVMLMSSAVFSSFRAIYFCFLIFEICVGIYFPSMGTLKSKLVPEGSRAALYNIFRVPLNAMVLGVLISDVNYSTALKCSAGFLALGFVLVLSIPGKSDTVGGMAEIDADHLAKQPLHEDAELGFEGS